MIRRYRRAWCVLCALILAAPLAVSAGNFARTGTAQAEKRTLAPMPNWPRRVSDWIAAPRRVDAFLGDHFGFRDSLIAAGAWVQHGLLSSGSPLVLIGRGGRFFFKGDDAVGQSAGRVMRRDWLAATIDLVADMHARLAARSIRFLVAPPPNAATIYPEALPRWARANGRPTEYDLFLSGLAARDVDALDLRPALRALKAVDHAYFRHDTHWTPHGALAAFDAVVAAAGLPDWAVSPELALGAPRPLVPGDLKNMLGLTWGLADTEAPMLPLPVSPVLLSPEPFASYVATSSSDGPTIMIIGDSFTQTFFVPLVMRHAGRLVWTWYRRCGFDWTLIDRFHPAQVWLMPTERQLPCLPGFRPAGMPAEPVVSAR